MGVGATLRRVAVAHSLLAALGRKYRVLSELRRGLVPGEVGVLKRLAAEFPGALRELDCLPLDVIDRRRDAVSRAEQGAPLEPWIEWMIAYHRLMRLALAAKRRLASARSPGFEQATRIALELRLECAEPCEPAFVERVASPPSGRLNRLVFEELAIVLGRSSFEIEGALFPELGARRANGLELE